MGKFRIETEGGHTYDIETEDPAPSYPKPPLPQELQGPSPSSFRQMLQNIPSSAMHAITNPYGPGVPSGNPVSAPGENIAGPTPESVGNELKNLIPHPIEDPVGTALNIATLGKFRRPIIGAGKGAVQGATEMVPLRHYGIPFDAPAPVAGAIVGGFAGMPFGHRELGAALGAGAPIVRGAVRGVREAMGESPRGKPAEGYSESETSVEPPGPVSPPQKFSQPKPQPTTPKVAASADTHVPGTTQAQEFLPPKVAAPSPIAPQGPQPVIPPSSLMPSRGAVSPQGPSTPAATEVIKPGTAPSGEPTLATPERDPALQALFDKYGERIRSHLESIPKKEANIIAWAKESKVPVGELEKLRDDLTQADDPKSYAAAIDKAKTYAKDIHSWGKDRGRDVPKDYRTFDLQDIETAIKALKSQLSPIPK